MQLKTRLQRTALSLGAAAALAVPASAQNLAGEIIVDGSSTVFPITQLVAEEFRADGNESVSIAVGFSGTGGGFKKFANGETHVSNASRPIKGSEADALSAAGIDFIEVPVSYDGLTIVVNRNNTWVDELTVEQLEMIFLAEHSDDINTWRDLDPAWPNIEIKMFIPGTDSGTFDYFKEVVAGKEGSIRDDVTPSEDDNILVRGIIGDRGAIGFFGCAYYFENADQLKAVAIINDAGDAVLPSTEAIEDGSYNPFSRPLFIYVREDALDRPEVAAFIDFYLDECPELCEEVGYVRLPDVIYDRARANVENRRTGSQYLDANGEKVEGPITEVYQ